MERESSRDIEKEGHLQEGKQEHMSKEFPNTAACRRLSELRDLTSSVDHVNKYLSSDFYPIL